MRDRGGSGVGPQARQADLIVRKIGRETVVYDLTRHRAHCLNPGAAAVFETCDGATDVASMADSLRQKLDRAVDASWVRTALEALHEAHLLERAPEAPAATPCPPSRRAVLRRGAAALLLPAVVSLVAPSPAEAADTCIPYQACTDANVGQSCYTGSATECTVAPKTCQGPGICN